MNLVHYLLKRGNSNKKMPVQKSHRHFFVPRDWREIGDISGIKSHRHNPTIVSLNRDYLPKLSISIDPISVFCQEYLQQRPHYPLGKGHARSFGNRITHLTNDFRLIYQLTQACPVMLLYGGHHASEIIRPIRKGRKCCYLQQKLTALKKLPPRDSNPDSTVQSRMSCH